MSINCYLFLFPEKSNGGDFKKFANFLLKKSELSGVLIENSTDENTETLLIDNPNDSDIYAAIENCRYFTFHCIIKGIETSVSMSCFDFNSVTISVQLSMINEITDSDFYCFNEIIFYCCSYSGFTYALWFEESIYIDEIISRVSFGKNITINTLLNDGCIDIHSIFIYKYSTAKNINGINISKTGFCIENFEQYKINN